MLRGLRIWSVLCWLGLLAGGLLPADARVVDLLGPPAAAWRPGKGSPRAADNPAGPGLIMPCPFRQGLDRTYWDLDRSLNLDAFTRLELELECTHPAAVRRVGLYLKSGAGWYVWLVPLAGAGRQRLVLHRRDAGTEGRPAGWERIDGIRLSVMPAAVDNTRLTLLGLTAGRPAMALVRGTSSTPNQAEHNAAKSAARRIGRRLDQLGLAHTVMDDDDLTAGALAGLDLVILPYNPHPSQRQLQALRDYIAGGGKLLVFYSAEPALAEMMGLRLGDYQRADNPGRWSAFAFDRTAPAGVPPLVRQESQNIRPVYPRDSSARIIARWRDAAGRTGADPAWVSSPAGFWMSHILLDGDDDNKNLLLLALLGKYVPDVWREAARQAVERAGRIGPYTDPDRALAGIRRRAGAARRAPAAASHLLDARALRAAVLRGMDRADHRSVLRDAQELRRALVRAYAAALPPRPGELRGVWNHTGTGLYPGDWPRTCRLLAESGITAVFPNLLWAGVAHYPSKVVPASDVHRLHGDQLRQASESARAAGLEMHLWKVCWNLGAAPAAESARLKQAGRLQRSDTGAVLQWLCPSHPANVAQELAAIDEAARSGLVDGIHLDYVRYPGPQACFCDNCRSGFEKALGRSVPDWPAAARRGKLAGRYQEWRCRQITEFVRQARGRLARYKNKIRLSAAVYQSYPACRISVGQDWGAWLTAGLVDFVAPMNYTENADEFAAVLAGQTRRPAAAGRIYPGLGVTASESRLLPDQVMEQILRLRALNCGGFILFDLNPTLADETLPVLRLSVFGR